MGRTRERPSSVRQEVYSCRRLQAERGRLGDVQVASEEQDRDAALPSGPPWLPSLGSSVRIFERLLEQRQGSKVSAIVGGRK